MAREYLKAADENHQQIEKRLNSLDKKINKDLEEILAKLERIETKERELSLQPINLNQHHP